MKKGFHTEQIFLLLFQVFLKIKSNGNNKFLFIFHSFYNCLSSLSDSVALCFLYEIYLPLKVVEYNLPFQPLGLALQTKFIRFLTFLCSICVLSIHINMYLPKRSPNILLFKTIHEQYFYIKFQIMITLEHVKRFQEQLKNLQR